MSEPISSAPTDAKAARILLPNIGAEEDPNGQAISIQAPALVAARLWALLFGKRDTLYLPEGDAKGPSIRCEALWPADLGDPPEEAAFPWLVPGGVHAWLNTETAVAHAREAFGEPLVGPAPESVRALGDKANTARVCAELGLGPASLLQLIEPLTPEECLDPDTLIPRLDALLRSWPDWTERRFTLKPRFGTSGRGRAGGIDSVDTPAIRGALPRLAARGGAMLEPWLKRQADLSVSLLVPPPETSEALPTILGSLEMLTSPSGLYRGHCGEIDNRGRVFSGHREDEFLRGEAALLAADARRSGFSGPCGVDAFTYLEEDRIRLRSAVEFNPRITMGIVTIGLIRRALPRVREALDLSPGQRRGFLMTTFGEQDLPRREAMLARLGKDALVIDLASSRIEPYSAAVAGEHENGASRDAAALRPMLFFTPDLESLRAAYREATGC
jgi:hypothetical protein